MSSFGNAVLLIPTLNEEQSIGKVIKTAYQYVDEIIVLDGKSEDKTVEEAKNAGAKVVVQDGEGKGAAVIHGLKMINGKTKVAVIVDGDSTYEIEALPSIIEPILNDEADLVIGDRLTGEIQPGSFTVLNKLGNKILSELASFFHNTGNIDTLSGFRAIRTDIIPWLIENLSYKGFETEIEMTILASKGGVRIKSIPIKYSKRPEGSKSKLSPLFDGFSILKTIILMNFRKVENHQNQTEIMKIN